MKAPEAGNTAESLRGTDVNVAAEQIRAGLPSAEDLDAVVQEAEITAAAHEAIAADPELQAQIIEDLDQEAAESDENSAFVSRAEFDALIQRIEDFNRRSGHRL